MRVALVHDYLVQYGGAERVLDALTEIFPDAPIYTLLYDPQAMKDTFTNRTIHTSFLQNLPFARRRHRLFPPLMPLASETFDLSEYDVVISSSNSYAKGVITGPDTVHISYCHTPMRYAWEDCHRYLNEFRYSPMIKPFIPYFMNYIRMWDKTSADRVDYYIANSRCVSSRIQKYYNRSSTVINPPVNTHFADHISQTFSPPNSPYYIMLGRFLPYKHYDIVIEAFRTRSEHLKIIGSGPEESYLRQLAQDSPNIEFLGQQSDEYVWEYLRNAEGFIFPSEDDFGIVPVEAMATGTPVLAYRGGGALETVQEGRTGAFFDRQNADSVKSALQEFVQYSFNSETIKAHAQTFNKSRFQNEFLRFVNSALNITG